MFLSLIMKKIVVFSGAGMSAESGVDTFRDSQGLWGKYAIEEVASPQGWSANPDRVSEFYNLRRRQIIETDPNEAHKILAKLETYYDIQIITQNIDDLHERAGSTNVLHLHGNIRYAKSSGPNPEKEYYPIEGWELKKTNLCPEGFRLRPHVVWFGEQVPLMSKATAIMETAEICIIIGTSLSVYPAAGLIHYINPKAKTYLIDPGIKEKEIPHQIQIRKQGAVEGMQQLYTELIS